MMMKNILGLFTIVGLLMISCESEPASRSAVNNSALGDYVLTSLIADVAVDFNHDGISNTELLNEATCFSSMDVSFMANGDFTATVAEPDFDAMNNFSCSTSLQSGTYSLDTASVLTIVANVNGGTVTENKQVTFTTTTFEFTITGAELNQYISDRTGTPAGNISSLQVVYTKI